MGRREGREEGCLVGWRDGLDEGWIDGCIVGRAIG